MKATPSYHIQTAISFRQFYATVIHDKDKSVTQTTMHRYLFRMNNLLYLHLVCEATDMAYYKYKLCYWNNTICRHVLPHNISWPADGMYSFAIYPTLTPVSSAHLNFLVRFRHTTTHFTCYGHLKNCLASSSSRSSITTYDLLTTVMPSVGYVHK
jgi:hypothetical protein